MVRRASFFVFFFLIFAVNLVMIAVFYRNTRIAKAQQNVLAEIEHTASPQSQFALSAAPLVLGAMKDEVILEDGRVQNLQNFFRRYNSPLYDYAQFIVQTADKYKFDYRLYPAIAMQESEGCKKIPTASYNCTGLGIYGDQVWGFKSFEENIEATSQVLKKNYIDNGLITPEDVMRKYTPGSSGSWADAVIYFFKALE